MEYIMQNKCLDYRESKLIIGEGLVLQILSHVIQSRRSLQGLHTSGHRPLQHPAKEGPSSALTLFCTHTECPTEISVFGVSL